MKNRKRIVSVLLSCCMAAGLLFAAPQSASAKTQTGVKVTFNKKTVVFDRTYVDEGGEFKAKTKSEPKTLKDVEKKWGKKTRLAGKNEEYAGQAYVWEKGKTKITIMQDAGGAGLGYVELNIRDKNASVAGVKVGMKRAAAVKKLQKLYGKKRVAQLRDGQYASPDEKGSLNIDGKAKGKAYTSIEVSAGADGMTLSFTLKNGKVSGIYWMRS